MTGAIQHAGESRSCLLQAKLPGPGTWDFREISSNRRPAVIKSVKKADISSGGYTGLVPAGGLDWACSCHELRRLYMDIACCSYPDGGGGRGVQGRPVKYFPSTFRKSQYVRRDQYMKSVPEASLHNNSRSPSWQPHVLHYFMSRLLHGQQFWWLVNNGSTALLSLFQPHGLASLAHGQALSIKSHGPG